MLALDQIDEVRRIVRLEVLRSAVLSVASESLDDNVTRFSIEVVADGDLLAASFSYSDSSGNVMAGGTL